MLCGNEYLTNLHHWVVGGLNRLMYLKARIFGIELDIEVFGVFLFG